MTINIMKKFLRLLGIVWSTALTILVLAVLLLKVDLVLEILASTPVVAVICLVSGVALGFIAGTIAHYFNTAKTIEAKDNKIRKLQNELTRLSSDYNDACKSLTHIYNQREKHQKKAAQKRGLHILTQIENFSGDSEETDTENSEEVTLLQDVLAEGTQSPA